MSTLVINKKNKQKPSKEFTFNEALTAAMNYFNGDELAATTWLNKYAMKGKDGGFLEKTPEEMHRRMAKEFYRVDKKYQEQQGNKVKNNISAYGQKRVALTEDAIFQLFDEFKYVIPQGSVMATLGNPHVIASLSNCIVLPEIYDSYGGIFYTDQQMAQLFKRRCGVGIDLSTLRPAGMDVSNAAGTTTGAASFMERFSNTTREVAQNGRRGALMITLDAAHPDVESFVTIKQDLSKVTGANISVRISDEFMKAVEAGTDFRQRWPIDAEKPEMEKMIPARDLWNTIIKCAHNTAEPGIIYWDRQHYYSTSSVYPGFKNVSTNPCSEIAMQGGDSCRLIAINLFSFVTDPFTSKAKFDTERFYKVTYESQRLMDNLVDLEIEAVERILGKIKSDPEPDAIKQVEIDTWKLLLNAGKRGRRTGLGFTALADMFAALGLSFDSEETLEMAEQMMKLKCRAEFDSSIDMAIERGRFNDFNPEIEMQSEFIQMMQKELPDVFDRMMKYGRRNISLSTVAPTGTLSILAQCSSGIEPVFMLSYKRRRKVNRDDTKARVDFTDDSGDTWQEFTIYHPKLKLWMEASGENDETKSPWAGSTAPEIDWLKRIRLQSIVQKYTTHSISSTINLPSDVSEEKVGDIYFEAWKNGLKGITVYRDGSRSGILVSTTEKKKASLESQRPPKRPNILEADVVRFQNGAEKWIAVVGLLEDRPYEIFTGRAEEAFIVPERITKGWVIKSITETATKRYDFRYVDRDGYKVTIEGLSRCFSPEFWNYAKLISGIVRHGMPIPHVVDVVENLNLHDASINTWKNGVARALKKYIADGTAAVDKKCSSCGDPDGLIYEEGCLKCKSCGHSKCG
ncbi:adenosylcobalamin-dependent ribonucleoside-diphosphate reductase [soil metagenome]